MVNAALNVDLKSRLGAEAERLEEICESGKMTFAGHYALPINEITLGGEQ